MTSAGSESPFVLTERKRSIVSLFGLAPDLHGGARWAIAVSVCIAWVPLLGLSLLGGAAFGDQVRISFLTDYVPHGRYLFAVPALLLMDVLVERHTSLAVARVCATGLVAEPERFQQIVAAARRAWKSRVVHWTFAAAAYALAVFAFGWERGHRLSTWVFDAEGGVSMAGLWNIFVSAALARFLLLRAIWKLAVWLWVVARLSRLPLQLDPLHPDRRCGLRFLGETQLPFSALVAAGGVQIGCVMANAVRFQGAQPASFRLMVVVFVALSLAIVLGPLIVFAFKAYWAQVRGLYAFGSWASLAARHMSGRLNESERERLKEELGLSEISSMTDASSLFDRLRATQPVPVDLRQVVTVTLAAIIPMTAPLVTLLPLTQILQTLTRILL